MIRPLALIFISAALYCPTARAQASISATPSSSRSPLQRFPRISGLQDQQIQAQVNAHLTNREEADRSKREDCIGTTMGPFRGEYSETIHVSYLSPRILSIDVRASFLCGAYPNDDMSYPFNLDLIHGEELNWQRFFIDGFMDFAGGESSPLMKAYLKGSAPDPDCLHAINTSNMTFDLWLDRSRKQLMVRPSLPHVVRACAKVVGIPFNDLQFSIRDPLDRRDLITQLSATHPKATVRN
jgi:hypothetical protein